MNNLAKEIHAINVNNGFYEEEKNMGEMLALIHSEVSEALEADRKGVYCDDTLIYSIGGIESNKGFKDDFERRVKDTFEDELADAVIRILDLAAFKGIDIEEHVRLKMRYNSLREYKHGKKY